MDNDLSTQKQMAEAVFGQLSGLMQCHLCQEWSQVLWTRVIDPKTAAETLSCERCFKASRYRQPPAR